MDSTLFQTVFGGGIANLQDDHEDFTKSSNTLLVANDSKFRASGLVGGLFRLGTMPTRFWGRKQISLLASFQFTQGTQSLLDGTFFGFGLELNPYLHVTVGGGLRKGKELSPGFRKAAAETIAAQIAAGNTAYLRFKDYTLTNKDEALLDGLPLTTAGAAAPFFPGEPIVESYNWSYFVGISVPVKLTELLGARKGG